MQFPRKTISASLINGYYDCPLQWKKLNIDGLIPPYSKALECGSMFDLMVKSFHENKDPYEEAKAKYLKGKSSKDTIEQYGIARKLMESYITNPLKLEHTRFDVRFKVSLEHPETGKVIEYPLTGFLDGLETIDGGAEIIEYKTTSKDYTQEQVDTSLQGDIYAYYLFRNFGIEEPVIRYVVGNKGSRKFQHLTTKRTKQNFIKLFDTVEKFIEDVRAERFEMNPKHPFWCICKKL